MTNEHGSLTATMDHKYNMTITPISCRRRHFMWSDQKISMILAVDLSFNMRIPTMMSLCNPHCDNSLMVASGRKSNLLVLCNNIYSFSRFFNCQHIMINFIQLYTIITLCNLLYAVLLTQYLLI